MSNWNSLTNHIGIESNITYSEAMMLSPDELRKLLHTNKFLVFKGWNNLTPVDILEFAKKFGKIWSYSDYQKIKEIARFSSTGEAYTDYSDKSYARLFAGIPWHVDISNEIGFSRNPARILYCIDLPSSYTGFSTDITSLVEAYSNLSIEDKNLFDNSYLIYQSWQQPGTNIKELPAIDVHPYTGEKYLRFNAVSRDNGWIRGWYKLNNDGTKEHLDNELLKKYILELGNKYSYSHNWEIGDLLIFDNWGTMHRKGPGEIFADSVGNRRFIRVTIDSELDNDYTPK